MSAGAIRVCTSIAAKPATPARTPAAAHPRPGRRTGPRAGGIASIGSVCTSTPSLDRDRTPGGRGNDRPPGVPGTRERGPADPGSRQQLDVADYLLIAFVSVVGSAATAGLTGAVVVLTLTLSTLGLPLAGVGLLLAIDPILDMMRTATNVAGQALVPTIVAKREGLLDVDRYNAPRGADPLRDEEQPAILAPAV
jgi:hypothetical protein